MKRKYEKETIIRRKSKYGQPIGPYLKIKNENGDSISAKVIETGEEVLLLKRNIYIPSTNAIPVNKELLEQLKNKKEICVQHKLSPLWRKIKSKNPELIKLYSMWYSEYVIMSVENITIHKTSEGPIVRIVLSTIIDKL